VRIYLPLTQRPCNPIPRRTSICIWGLYAITLGILALVGIIPQTLMLVGILLVGGAAVLSGGALVSKMVGLLYH
jgi:hypothetical protein